jgi:hypothetical protein
MIHLSLKDILKGYRTGIVDKSGTFHKHGTFEVNVYTCKLCKSTEWGLICGLCKKCFLKADPAFFETDEQRAAYDYYCDSSNKVEWYDLSTGQREAYIKNLLVPNLQRIE